MDWRTGKPNSTGSAFRGISTRGRGRGRGRGAPPSGRGGHNTNALVEPPLPPSPLPAAATQGSPTLNLPPRPKSTSRRGSHQHARRAPSLSQLDLSKATAPSAQQQTTGPLPQVSRRASHNPLGVSQNEPNSSKPQIPSLKLDTSSPTTPASSRPKPARKRSQNRTRSSSKTSAQDRLSAIASIASLKEREKDMPPHLALASAPPDVQSFELRTNIDTLVERVRAMAMAGSTMDRDKDKEGHHTFGEGHIDWAGDDDDTLPDLDDWVRPKSAEPKQEDQATENKASDKPILSPVEESSSSLPSNEEGQEKKKEKTVASHVAKDGDKSQHAEEAKEVKELKATNEANSVKEKESGSGRTKTRGRHGRKKGSTSESLSAEANGTSSAAKSLAAESAKQVTTDSSVLSTPKIRPPLVHPLPPKPQSTPSPARIPKPRAPPQTTLAVQPTIQLPESTFREPPPSEEKLVLGPPIDFVEPPVNVETTSPPQPVKKRAFDPMIDWANAPPSSNPPTHEETCIAKDDPHLSTPPIEPQGKTRMFDSTVDWANAPRSTRRSPTRGTPSPKRAHPFLLPSISHSQTAPPRDRSRGPFPPFRNASPPVFPDLAQDTPHPSQTRSQVNSPEPSPRRWLNREGSTHLRSHSSPQTGPGTRTHASRPVITLDAISRISRTLGVSRAATPPHGQAVGVTVNE